MNQGAEILPYKLFAVKTRRLQGLGSRFPKSLLVVYLYIQLTNSMIFQRGWLKPPTSSTITKAKIGDSPHDHWPNGESHSHSEPTGTDDAPRYAPRNRAWRMMPRPARRPCLCPDNVPIVPRGRAENQDCLMVIR